jgi:serine/threonine protein kinase
MPQNSELVQGKGFAVKQYLVTVETSPIEITLILNEIHFLRELKVCDNIVTIVSVFTSWDPATGNKTISLVMKYAPYGSLLNHLKSKRKFSEEEIRTVMA